MFFLLLIVCRPVFPHLLLISSLKKDGLNKLFGSSIRKLRIEKGWSQDELAHRASLHRTYVGGVERSERNVTLETVERLSDALGVTPWKLLK